MAYSPFERVFESSELMFYAMLEVQPHELHFICTCSFFVPRPCPFRCLFNLQIVRSGSRCCSRELVSFGSFVREGGEGEENVLEVLLELRHQLSTVYNPIQ